jgi:peptide/nickel transport system substrate-binding protein
MMGALLSVIFGSAAALAQKQGGILRVHALDSPPSLSMHEEADAVPARATMGLFNNLVMFDQHAKQNNMQSIVPDLATGWSWSEDGNRTDFPIARGGQMARRQTLHRRGCQMHLGSAHR